MDQAKLRKSQEGASLPIGLASKSESETKSESESKWNSESNSEAEWKSASESNTESKAEAVGAVARPAFVASTSRRVQAFFIDESLRALAFVPWWIATGARFSTGENWRYSGMWLLLCYSFHFLARVMFLRMAGGTPGKLLMGLRLVGRDVDQLQWSQCGLRTLTDDLSMVMGWGPRMLAFLRFDRTHLSDWIAETRVIQEMPRTQFPHRRWAVGLVLFFVFSVNGLASTWRLTARLSGHREGDKHLFAIRHLEGYNQSRQ